LAQKDIVRWAQTDGDVQHYARIGQECLRAMTGLRSHLTVVLWNKTRIEGWLESINQGSDGDDPEAPPLFPTSWYGSVTLQKGDRQIEIDFLDIETVHASQPPLKLIDKIDTAYLPKNRK
jgi:hypothetical protein